MKKHWFSLLAAGILTLSIAVSVSAFAGSDNPASRKDQAAFSKLWEKAFRAENFSYRQTVQAKQVLDDASQQLSDNDRLWQTLSQQAGQPANAAQKQLLAQRIDAVQSERDLIVMRATAQLNDFLNQNQRDFLVLGAFHNVSVLSSGAFHLNQLFEASRDATDAQTAKDLSAAAERLNVNDQPVTLGLVINGLAHRIFIEPNRGHRG